MTKPVFHQASIVTKQDRSLIKNQRSAILWFTGLSGSGKTTLAHALEDRLFKLNYHTYVLDGDNLRQGLCHDLQFSDKDRHENIRRVGEVGKLFVDSGIITLTAFISPFRVDRASIKNLFSSQDFFEIYCDCPLDVCEKRDVKGLYKLARQGDIKEFTGISSPYEVPLKPDLTIKTGEQTIDQSISQLMDFLLSQKIIRTL